MKHTIQLVILVVIITALLVSCQPSMSQNQKMATATAHIATSNAIKNSYIQAAQPTRKPQPKDSSVVGTWYFDSDYSPYTIIIKKVGASYSLEEIYSEGSSQTINLLTEKTGNEERLYETPSNAFGDYMVIESNGRLSFYDSQGFILSLKPEK